MLQESCLTAGAILAQMPEWLENVRSFAYVILGFSLIVFVHELGHFVAAKWAGVRVERFAIGFGKELFGFTRGETRYSFNVLPLGGYVKMLGQEDFVVDKSGELKVRQDARSFTNKPVGKRMVIVTAGVIMNLLFAAAAFTIVAMVGRKHLPPVLGFVDKNKPAGRAGLQPGDRIREINGTPVDDFIHLHQMVSLSGEGEKLTLMVERDGRIVEPYPELLPEYVEEEEIRQIGVAPGWTRRVMAVAGLQDAGGPDPAQLRPNDELHMLVTDGREEEIGDIRTFLRKVLSANGEPLRVIVKRPKNPEALTDEQLYAADTEVEGSPQQVEIQPLWTPLPYDRKATGGSLLGLVPRLTVLMVEPGKSWDKAGVRDGDVLVRLGNQFYPNAREVKEVVERRGGQSIDVEVRRSRAANRGLEAGTIAFCVRHREALIAAGLADRAKAEATLARLAAESGVSPAEIDKLKEKLQAAATPTAWREWLETVDVHTLSPLVPRRPFALFSSPPPTLDAILQTADEDHLVVAGVVEKFGDRVTPAYAAGIRNGAVILKVDDEPVSRWYQLASALRRKAGKKVKLTYRLLDEVATAEMRVPESVQTALGLSRLDRIVHIDGKRTFTISTPEGEERRLSLPDWRATEAALRQSVGKTVEIEWADVDGERHTGQYAVTENNTDPWPDRIDYALTFSPYPLIERQPISNPAVALVSGVRQAYRATLYTVRTIYQMIITRNVGFKKVSGPVGILRIGSDAAKSGPLELLWLMGLLSANLAVINFLPLPIVDGGLFLFLLLEKVRGEPVSIKTQVATQLIGIALIITVFLLVTYQDILHWITGA